MGCVLKDWRETSEGGMKGERERQRDGNDLPLLERLDSKSKKMLKHRPASFLSSNYCSIQKANNFIEILW